VSTVAKEKAARVGDAAVAARTGKTWAEWFESLEAAGARGMDHKAIVALLAERLGVENGWWCQMIANTYEQARGTRQKHETCDGFQVGGSVTVAVPLASLYNAWTDESVRCRWLSDGMLSIRKATPEKSLRIAWDEGASRVDVNFYAKGTAKSQVALQHSRLPDAATGERMKEYWKEQLGKLKALLEERAR
jgi:uncharacterized protein YndB with AHSA1/START domain